MMIVIPASQVEDTWDASEDTEAQRNLPRITQLARRDRGARTQGLPNPNFEFFPLHRTASLK